MRVRDFIYLVINGTLPGLLLQKAFPTFDTRLRGFLGTDYTYYGSYVNLRVSPLYPDKHGNEAGRFLRRFRPEPKDPVYRFKCATCGWLMMDDLAVNAHRGQYHTHKIVFADDLGRNKSIQLSYFIHNLLLRRKGVPTIIKLVKLCFDRDLSYEEIWRLDALVGTNVRYGSEPPSFGLTGSGDESGNQALEGYEKTNAPQGSLRTLSGNSKGIKNASGNTSQPLDFSNNAPYNQGSPEIGGKIPKKGFGSTQVNREEGNFSDMEVLKKQNKLLTYGKGPLSPIQGVSGRSREQYEIDLRFHNKSRREKRVWKAVEDGRIPGDAVDLFLEHFDPKTRRTIPAELKLPRGRKGGRNPKEKPNPLYENQMVVT